MDLTFNEMLIKKNELQHVICMQNRLYHLLKQYSYEYIPLPNIKITTVNPMFYLYHNITQMERYVYDVDIINTKLLYNFNHNPIRGHTNEHNTFDNLSMIFPKDVISSDIKVSDISDNTDLL
jgi:hypothetical protein